MNHQKAESKLNFFWIFSVVLVTGILSYRFPSATYLAQPFAEHATNYFVAGVIGNSNFMDFFLLKDYGYFVFLPRLVFFLAIKIFGYKAAFPLLTQYLAIILIAFFGSSLNSRSLRSLIPSDLARFFVGLFVSLHWGMGMYLFHNLGYYAVVIATVSIFFDWESWSYLKVFLFSSLIALAVASKAYFVVFFPIFVVYLGFQLKSKKWKSSLAAIPILVTLGLQIASISHGGGSSPPNLIGLISRIFNFYLHSFGAVFWPFKMAPWPSVSFGVLMLILMAYLCSNRIKARDQEGILFWVATLFIGLSVSALTTLAFYGTSEVPLNDKPSFMDESHHFFLMVSVFLGTIVLLLRRWTNKWIQIPVVIVLGLASSTFCYFMHLEPRSDDPYRNPLLSSANWPSYGSLLDSPDYCIPINPGGWYLSKDCGPIKTAFAKRGHILEVESPDGPRKLRAVGFQNKDLEFKKPVSAIIRQSGSSQIIKEMSLPGSVFRYFVLPTKVNLPISLQFFDSDKRLDISPDRIILFGSS